MASIYTPLLDHPTVEMVYRESDNYKVLAGKGKSKICMIFFSGNGLYFPNTEAEFFRTVVKEDRYEWTNIAASRAVLEYAERIIFVRDVHKQWYLTGISARVDNIDALTEELKPLIEGYTVITAGNSAGGYMACMMGLRLHAKYAYSFNGQFSLWLEEMENHPYLVKFREEKKELYRYDEALKTSEMQTIYFFAGENKADQSQYALVKDVSSVHAIAFKEEVHGKNMLPENLPYALVQPEKMIALSEKYRGRSRSQIRFLFDSCGLLIGFGALVRGAVRKYRKKRQNK